MKTIKAVVTSTSALSGAYFGHTFDVGDIHPGGRVSLIIEGRTVDFSFREVLIVDLPALTQEVYVLSWSLTSYPFPFMPSAQTPTALYTALCRFADIRYIKHTLVHNV